MFLNKIAQENLRENFDSYERATGDFLLNDFQGRIDLTDRFLTIYNRPTRKRQLFTAPETKMPESGIMRHPHTGSIYIVGSPRMDARWDVAGGKPYIQLSMLHEVTPAGTTSGLAKHTRKVFEGAEQDWLVTEELAEKYMDVEFRTSANDVDVFLGTIENYFAWLSLSETIERFDTLTIGTVSYLVLDVYTEMGMTSLRVAKRDDPRVNLKFFRKGKVFNEDTLQYETTTKEERVTGMVPKATDNLELDSSAVVVVDTDHILFEPKVNMDIEIHGRKLTVQSVFLQASERQWRLTVG